MLIFHTKPQETAGGLSVGVERLATLELWVGNHSNNWGDRAFAVFNDFQLPGCPLSGIELDMHLAGAAGSYMYWEVYFASESQEDFFNCYALTFEIRPDANRISLIKWENGEATAIIDQASGLSLALGDVYHVLVDAHTGEVVSGEAPVGKWAKTTVFDIFFGLIAGIFALIGISSDGASTWAVWIAVALGLLVAAYTAWTGFRKS